MEEELSDAEEPREELAGQPSGKRRSAKLKVNKKRGGPKSAQGDGEVLASTSGADAAPAEVNGARTSHADLALQDASGRTPGDGSPGADDADPLAVTKTSTTASAGKKRLSMKPKRTKVWKTEIGDDDAAEGKRHPCLEFPIGAEIFVRYPVKLRSSDSPDGEEIDSLKKDDRCTVLEHGTAESGRRLRVCVRQSGKEGWVTCLLQNGRQALRLAPGPESALPQGASSPATSGADAAVIAAATASRPASVRQACPTDSAQPAAVASRLPAAPSQPCPPGNKAEVSHAPSVSSRASPAAPAPPQRSTEGKQRVQNISRLFNALDRYNKGVLFSDELHAYARLCGFEESAMQWAREYDGLCTMYGWNAAEGTGLAGLTELVNDPDGAAFCTDDELVSVLLEVESNGVPWPDDASPSGKASPEAPPLPASGCSGSVETPFTPVSDASETASRGTNLVRKASGSMSRTGSRISSVASGMLAAIRVPSVSGLRRNKMDSE